MDGTTTNSKILFESIQASLRGFEKDEAHAIALRIIDHFYNFSWTDILLEKKVLPIDFTELILRLNRHEPIQYILGKTDFYGRKFFVTPAVLIPRPETELLIDEVIKEKNSSPIVLDVGTGSGCIAIALKLEMRTSKIYALDVSTDALSIAQKNADALHADIHFIHADFLKDDPRIEAVDILVSNPPYIAEAEKKAMHPNVLQYEPVLALFVTDDDPLIFYKNIAEKSKRLLKPNGKIFVEINERFGHEVAHLFQQHGFFNTQIIPDWNGKARIVVAAQ